MDSSSDNEQNTGADSSSLTEESQRTSSTRRRFARNAVVGSAVVLSLGNRVAWGEPVVGACMSTRVLDSFRPTGAFLSGHNADHNTTTAGDIIDIENGRYRDDYYLEREQTTTGTDICIRETPETTAPDIGNKSMQTRKSFLMGKKPAL